MDANKLIKIMLRTWVVAILSFIFIFSQTSFRALALSPAQLKVLRSGIRYYNVERDCASGISNTTTGSSGSDADIWNSGLNPPYILEQFAIETLKALAAKRGVDQSVTVTQEHVLGLLAFMLGEGGDINNPQVYNPLNTGLYAPELIEGTARGDGVQSFKSFDAGVEATARTMVGSFQSRLADVLTQPNTTAEDFMKALSYWFNYPGNHPWAEASRGNEDNYFQTRMQLVAQVNSNYEGIAALVIGTPEKEQLLNITHPELLQFSGGISLGGSSSSNNCNTGSGVVQHNIAQTAINFSWPESHGLEPKPEYAQAISEFNPGAPYKGADCGAFVGTVMRASGADPDYPHYGTSRQEAYVRAHPEKYDVVDRVDSTADLLPGDILIVNKGSGEGAAGHTYIFVGPQPNGTNAASASGGERMPNLGMAEVVDSLGRGNYLRARLK